jgi:hypothetical protein
VRDKIRNVKYVLKNSGHKIEEHPDDSSGMPELNVWGERIDDYPDYSGFGMPPQRKEKSIEYTALPSSNNAPEPKHNPPEFATRLLGHLPMDDNTREAMEGDLEEEYCKLYYRSGRREADAWYYRQVIASLWPFLIAKLRHLVEQVRQRLG